MIYTVRWTIDIVAASAVDAAQEARGIQLDPLALATAFEVTDANGETVMVDLGEGLGEELPAGAPSVLDKVKPGRFVLDAAREARDRTLEELAGTVRVGADAPEWPLDAPPTEIPTAEIERWGLLRGGELHITAVGREKLKFHGHAVVPQHVLNALLSSITSILAVYDKSRPVIDNLAAEMDVLADCAKAVREAIT